MVERRSIPKDGEEGIPTVGGEEGAAGGAPDVPRQDVPTGGATGAASGGAAEEDVLDSGSAGWPHPDRRLLRVGIRTRRELSAGSRAS